MSKTPTGDSRCGTDRNHIDRVLSMVMHYEEVRKIAEALKELQTPPPPGKTPKGEREQE